MPEKDNVQICLLYVTTWLYEPSKTYHKDYVEGWSATVIK